MPSALPFGVFPPLLCACTCHLGGEVNLTEKNGFSSNQVSFQPGQPFELLTSGDACARQGRCEQPKGGRREDTTTFFSGSASWCHLPVNEMLAPGCIFVISLSWSLVAAVAERDGFPFSLPWCQLPCPGTGSGAGVGWPREGGQDDWKPVISFIGCNSSLSCLWLLLMQGRDVGTRDLYPKFGEGGLLQTGPWKGERL